jgi:hypothetical protein
MDLVSLDRRSYARAIEPEVERLRSLPIRLSVIVNAKSILESQLNFLSGLREVATPEQACQLDAEIARKRAHLTRIDAELASRSGEEQVEPMRDSQSSNIRVSLAPRLQIVKSFRRS